MSTERVSIVRAVEVVAAIAAASFLAAPASAQRQPYNAQQPATANTGAAADDFTADGMKFHKMPGSGQYGGPAVYQVVDIASSNPAGQMLVRADGSKTVMSYPGFDKSKIEAAYDSHANGTATEAAAATVPPGTTASANLAPVKVGFDPANRIVTLQDGRSVRYIDDTHAEVKLPGPAGMQTYELEYHKGGAGGFARSWADAGSGRATGSSFGGSGVIITLASANGMPGGQVYDTARGTNVRSGIDRLKPIISAVTEANQSAPDNLRNTKVIKSLENNNLGLH
jgi:hypothetical protein